MENWSNESSGEADSRARSLIQPPGAKSPTAARRDCRRPGVTIHNGDSIKQRLRDMSVTIIKHERLAKPFKHRVREDMSPLVYFLCAAHGLRPPDIHDVTAAAVVGEPIRLPLAHWGGIYYALIAEIDYLYNKIHELYMCDQHYGESMMHNSGANCNQQNDAFTVTDFSDMLVEFWKTLMESGFLAPLDHAVRIENYAETFRREFHDREGREEFHEYWDRLHREEKTEILDNTDGMVDVTNMLPGAIADMLWERYAPKLNRASAEELRAEGILAPLLARPPRPPRPTSTPRSAQLHPVAPIGDHETPDQDDQNQESLAEENSYLTFPEKPCFCPQACHCKGTCQFGIQACDCKCKPYDRTLTPMAVQDRRLENQINRMFLSSDSQDTTGSPVQQPGPSRRAADPGRLENLESLGQRANARHEASSQTRRERSNTTRTQLAYVPEAPSARRPRDPVPLGLYGSRSPGGRYPQFQDSNANHNSGIVYGRSFYTPQAPPRRPVPPQGPTSFTTDHGTESDVHTQELRDDINLQLPKIPSILPPPRPRNPTPRMGSPTTRSGPNFGSNTTHGQTVDEFGNWEYTALQPSPNLIGSRSPLSRHSSPAIESSAGLNQNLPPPSMPSLPSFIQPRPALIQRYVAAGGNAPLHERPEIPAPVLRTTPDTGITMTPSEYLAFLERQNNMRTRNDSVAFPRASEDETAISSGANTGPRNSEDQVATEQRGRGDSNFEGGGAGGGMRNRLRRLLSGSQARPQ